MIGHNGDVPQGFKRCSRCGEIKALEGFSRNKAMKDGLQNQCRICQTESNRRWRQENPDKVRAQERRWAQANRDRRRESDRRSYERNPEKKREYSRRWKQENPDKVREKEHRRREINPEKERERNRRYYQENPDKKREKYRRRRARKSQLPVACPTNIESILFDVQNGQCMYCGCDLADGCHVDHIIPIVLVDLLGDKHPGHVPSNLALACPHCNVSKYATPLEDWLQWKYPDQMDEILKRVEAHIARMKEWDDVD